MLGNSKIDYYGINNVAITYFNYKEIALRARNDPAAIIILTYGQTKLYNELSSNQLLTVLNINHIPAYIFNNRYVVPYKGKLLYKYRTIDPQSYIKNTSFLTYPVSARYKALYIRALSMRRISDKSDKIPRNYFGEVAYNPFLIVDKDFIHFPLENKIK